MTAAPVVERKLQVFQDQRRRPAQLIFPDDGGVANADAPLLEQPMGKRRIALALGAETGDRDAASAIAPYLQHRPCESEQRQLRPAAPKGLP